MTLPSSNAADVHESVPRMAGTAFQSYAREVQRFLLRRVTDRQDVDDLSQEVFARLMRVESAELVRSPLAYLLGIATHVVREFRQRKQHQRVIFDSAIADSLSEHADTASRTAAPSTAEQLELQNWLDAALQHLPPTHQTILLLVKRDGLSYEEAAAATGLSVHTIEKYLVEARARLRVIMKELCAT